MVNSIEGTLEQELVEKWAFDRAADGKDDCSPRMDGEPQELREVVRDHL